MRSSASSSSLVQLNSVTSRQSLRHWIPLTLILLATSKPVIEPFWINLPYSHIFRSIMPDVLHQLYQGVLKHLIGWITTAIGAAEVDARCHRMPPNHNICHFFKGISSLFRISGH